jgi:membrane peptidoglycan carboxypeptidase
MPSRPSEARLDWKRWGRPGLLMALAALLLLAVLFAAGYLDLSTPSAADLPQRVDAIAGGHPLRPADVPPLLAHAVVAVEDERFYLHHGLDTLGTARAVWDDVTGLCACEGGSTITQQLAKNVYYQSDDRITRKIPSMAVALKIEVRYDKATIMADYLSVVPTGYSLVGAREAACAFFDRRLDQLSVSQAAEVAGMLAAPSIYDPRLHPDLARSRRDHVLDRMIETGYITTATAASAKQDPVLTANAAYSPNCG